jgi:uncharacterized protein
MEKQTNKEIVQKVYAGFKAKDLPMILSLQAEDSEWSVAGPASKIPWASPRRGHTGVAEFLKILGEWVVPEVFEINEYFENGDKVVALGFQSGKIRPTGKPYEFDFVHVWTLFKGKIKKFRVYYDTDYVARVLREPNTDSA